MADATATVREAIERQIKEIEEETAKLRRALGALVGGAGVSQRGDARRAPRRRRRKTAPPG